MTKYFLLVLLTISCSGLYGQQTDNSFNTWWANISSFDLSEKVFLKNELHIRRNDGFKKWQQFLVRPSLQYRLNDDLTLAAGYSFLINYPYDVSSTYTGYEHNVWEQVLLKHPVNKSTAKHRYRLEHRFPAELDSAGSIEGYGSSQRFRYRLTISRKLSEDSPWTIAIFNELFLDFENNTYRPTGVNQNWTFAGISWSANDILSIGTGYMYQFLRRSENLIESNHTLSTSVKLNF